MGMLVFFLVYERALKRARFFRNQRQGVIRLGWDASTSPLGVTVTNYI